MTEINLCNEVLQNAIGVHRSFEKIEPLNPMDAVAVQAMEELLKYRAIGTVEELQGVYKLCESLEEAVKVGDALVEELKKYQAIGTIEEFKALKEKNEPKKVVYKDHTNCCPTCDYHYDRSGREWIGKNCPNCGQAILRT